MKLNLEQTVQYLLDEVNKLKAGIAPGELIPGPQGVPGEKGDSPTVSISNNNTWIIDGVDTGKPSRGKQGEKGNTGMQGVPGVGVSTMLSIDSTDYTPTVTDDGQFQDVNSSAEIRYSGDGEEHSTQVDFNIKVPKVDLTDYRTAPEQDVIDNTKAPVQYVDDAIADVQALLPKIIRI